MSDNKYFTSYCNALFANFYMFRRLRVSWSRMIHKAAFVLAVGSAGETLYLQGARTLQAYLG